jgi:hypothetical protein
LEGSGEVESLEDDGKSGGLRFTEVSGEFRAKLANWLSADSSFSSSGREVIPAAAVPLDSMEKIREDIRGGNLPSPRQSQPVAPPSNPVAVSTSNPPKGVRKATPPAAPKRNEIPVALPAPKSSEMPAVNIENRKATRENVSNPTVLSNAEVEAKIPRRKIPGPATPDRLEPGKNVPDGHDANRLVIESPRSKLPVSEVPLERPPVTRLLLADSAVTQRPAANKTGSERPIIERIIPEPKSMPVFSERLPETKETPKHPSPLVPEPVQSPPETVKPAALSSAFLKLARETKAPVGTPVAPAAPAARLASSALFVPAPHPVRSASVIPEESPVTGQPRRYDPALDVSLDLAWEQAQLSSPEPPHLSRAAASGIILLALAVILGALGFNFRQEIGAVFIQLGHRISGEKGTVVLGTPGPDQATAESQPADPQNAAPTSRPAEPRQQSTPANSGNTGKALSTPEKTNGAAAPASDTPGTKSDAITSGDAKSAVTTAVPDVATTHEKPPEDSSPEDSTEVVTKTAAPPAAVTGQEEFEAAREILHGKNRAQDLSRAVALLWSAVKKGNVPAEMTLGDLYRRGDGVEKSCDQARVLLVAASKKGSADARQQLERMAEHGCE